MNTKFIKVKIDTIIPYEKNNKIHGENVDKIVQSIQRNTYIAPIIIDENNVILAWHGRYEAMKKLQQKEIWVIKVIGLSEIQKKDYRLSDNKIAELSLWNIGNIKAELDEIDIPELSELFELWDINIDTAEINFDDIESNEDRQVSNKLQNVCCPNCSQEFTI